MKRIVFSLLIALTAGVSFAALPEVSLQDTNGKTVNVATLTNSHKPLIISFFATWCKPCLQELKAIDELYEEWQEETGVEMYIVSIDQGQDIRKVKPLVDGFGWNYHVLLDPNGELKRAMNVQNVPHVFVIDSHGKTVYNHLSYTDGDELKLRKYLK
ncbi:MAG: TlpA family protein disulfide reductase [Paludibacteraceae bacterium]|nr:TlpA family protein disulfide reductase [Paludibacteraceae bacterium]